MKGNEVRNLRAYMMLSAGVILLLATSGCGENKGSTTTSKSTTTADTVVEHGKQAEWSYEGSDGPSKWGELSPKYSLCSAGKEQSPINLTEGIKSDAAVSVAYQTANTILENNGHTIQAAGSPKSTITVGDTKYKLLQFHFHSPSEHTLNGKHLPFELHVVNEGPAGKTAVLGVLGKVGKANPAFDQLWKNIPKQEGDSSPVKAFDADELLPTGSGSEAIYRYNGSLTTPPCSEGLVWSVYKKPITLSQKQIDQFQAIFHENARPVQPLNGREIQLGKSSEK